MDTKGNRIIAVDFDGTLHTGTWPEIGDVNMTVFNFCRNEQLNGARLILWTNRAGEQLEDAVAWCKERGLEFDAVNENLPELIELYGNDCRKINDGPDRIGYPEHLPGAGAVTSALRLLDP